MKDKHREEIFNLRFSSQASLPPPPSPFSFEAKGSDNLSPVGVSDVFSSPVLFLEESSPTPIIARSVSMDPVEKSNEIKSLTNRLTSVISHRNELLNTIESCNIHIQELHGSLKVREEREAELLNKLAEKDMLLGLLTEQLQRFAFHAYKKYAVLYVKIYFFHRQVFWRSKKLLGSIFKYECNVSGEQTSNFRRAVSRQFFLNE